MKTVEYEAIKLLNKETSMLIFDQVHGSALHADEAKACAAILADSSATSTSQAPTA